MKRILLSVLVLSLFGTSAFSADRKANRGPEIIRLEMGELTLPFKHWGHQKRLNNACSSCHVSKIGKIDDWGADAAHDLCVTCHETKGKGPVQCEGCHELAVSKSQLIPDPSSK